MSTINWEPHFLTSGIALATVFSLLIGTRLVSAPNRTRVISKDDERVLIIGASSGVGRVTAVEYSKHGARVAIVARREALLREVEQECAQFTDKPDRILSIVADFGNEDDMAGVLVAIEQAWNGLDTVVVAAGVSALQPVMSITKQGGVGHTKSVALRALEGNYLGPLVSAVTFIPLLEKTSQKPAIALISSLAAVVPAPTRALYCSTKSASLLLFQSLAIEHPRIKFTNVIPATIEGDFRASAVDGGEVREVLKGALKKQTVAQAIMNGVDTEARNVWLPSTMRVGLFLYWIWPGLIERMARKKYNFVLEG
ncbi:short chain dehydrogenase [Ceratobasidium sp. AG-Ba]|nr:short chain dehydrogenase [Ceratobasidium sp. AG-Ba]